jgi:tRNA 2-selenouridine synthase
MTVARVGEAEFARLLLADTPFIDVRAEVEFARGSIPGAVNLPILDSAEREQVGRCYKRQGQQAAIALGHDLVKGELKARRIAAWCAFARSHPGTHLFCWRGGLRSQLAADWMAEAGTAVPVIDGGYKALRHCLLRELEREPAPEPWVVIGGRTGSAKTALVNELPGGLDLEGLARHRGSSFGRRAVLPPAQLDFENALALMLLRRRAATPSATLWLEDESRQIGAVWIPLPMFRQMKEAPRVILEVPFAERVEQILDDYVCEDLATHRALDPEHGFDHFAGSLLNSLDRIRKRLGELRWREARALLEAALAQHRAHGDPALHREWIALLLSAYYDPMYEYQMEKSAARVLFRGERQAVRAWCLNRAARDPG